MDWNAPRGGPSLVAVFSLQAMHVIAKSSLLEFSGKHPASREKLLAWHRLMESCSAKDFNELKRTFSTADYVPDQFTVFDVGGNEYRIVTVIHYNTQRVYIRRVATHIEYDKWTRRNRGK
jgi:mRNA interferase HigB